MIHFIFYTLIKRLKDLVKQEINTNHTLLYLACKHMVFGVNTPKKDVGRTTQKIMVYQG